MAARASGGSHGIREWSATQSVHWTIVHEDDAGTPVALSSEGDTGRHPTIGNDVHVENDCAEGATRSRSRTWGAARGTRDGYRVTLRFTRREDAQDALRALNQVSEQDGMYVVAWKCR